MLPRLLVAQDVLIYQSPSQQAYKKGSHILQKLKEMYPDWLDKNQIFLPYVMRIKVDIRVNLPWEKPQLEILRKDIKTIVADLPASYRAGYEKIISVLANDDPVEMDIPRAIEYLTMVHARYILDCIRKTEPTLPIVLFDGLTLPTKSNRERRRWQVWIFHNHRSPDIDNLLIECQHLAVERIRTIMSGNKMNLLRILKIKCRKFKPAELIKKRGFYNLMGLF